jgi:hypothetical protein
MPHPEFRKWKTELTENSNFHLFVAKKKPESANLRLFAAHGSGKQKFVFLSRQTVNRNRRLLFEQTPIHADQQLPRHHHHMEFSTLAPTPLAVSTAPDLPV